MNNQNETSILNPGISAPEPSVPPSNLARSENVGVEQNEPSQVTGTWVSKRDRHMQLINSSIYDKETQFRNKAIEETRKQKAARRDQREQQKIERYLQSLASASNPSSSTPKVHDITVNGLRFHVLAGGGKLARIRGENKKANRNM